MGEAWNLVTDAPAAEKDEVIALVRDLATDEGRARLVAMYEAKLDSAKDDAVFENVEQPESSEPTDTNDPSEAKLPDDTPVRLVDPLPVGRRAFLGATGRVLRFNERIGRYIVELDDGHGTWRLAPRYVARQSVSIPELAVDVQQFDDATRAAVKDLTRLHGVSEVYVNHSTF